jgi:hypothetical protein
MKRWWRLLVVGCLGLAVAPAQAPDLSCRELAAADAVGVGIRFSHGIAGPAELGPPGAAVVLANCRLLAARLRVPGLQSGYVHVDDEVHAVVAVLPPDDLEAVRAFQAAVFAADRVLDDDAIARAIAGAALVADDAAFLFPGDVLWARARAALVGLGSVRGDAAALLALTPARVRELLRSPVGYSVAAVGAIPAVYRQQLQQIDWPPSPPALPPTLSVPPSGRREPTSELHPRVDAPFVGAAFVVPAEVSLPALAIGLEVLRSRGLRIDGGLPPRGSEALAHAPLVAWSWLHGDGLVRCHRRGLDPLRLTPNESRPRDAVSAEVEAQAAADELRQWLARTVGEPPSADEVAQARRTLVGELGLELAPDRVLDAALLPAWTTVQLLGTRRGIDAAALAAVDAEAAQRALQQVLTAAGGHWHTLLPKPLPDRVWLPRRGGGDRAGK